MAKKVDFTGKKYGRLTVIKRTKVEKGNSKWICVCDCGSTKEVYGCNLSSGDTTSCGCFARESSSVRNTTHGLTKTAEYKIWRSMINRCKYEYVNGYSNYGGRGIKVCDRWSEFENFLEDMGMRPSTAYTLDRVDVNGHYEPSNCKWSTASEQSINRRMRATNKTGYSGIFFREKYNTYQVSMCSKHIGIFHTIEEAIQARKEAEIKYWERSS